MVAGSHTTKKPISVTYSSVVFQYLVIIVLMVAALNVLDLQASDIENTYLNPPCSEKIWTRARLELEINKGKV